ncbi:hypothetical protein Cni_G08255 [Canna indica]|uniref:FAD-binding PCMH-type domain-containing protein n=1 Tax=Canna indica TaxID=4628 RepID=A0AAQ3K093_9LILI|nr:hypothetical protein Cni_G08255 [Canna indica]
MAKFLFIFSLLLLSANAAFAEVESQYFDCFLHSSNFTNEAIYAPNTTAYKTIFRSSIQNLRFLSNDDTTKPSFLIQPTRASDVQAAVSCGRRHGLGLRVRSGGHDYEGLSYVSAGGPFVIVDLANLRSVEVDSASGTAWVGAGATVGEVYYNVGVNNRTAAFPAGICTTIGVGGHFSGGGIGSLMRKYGLSADNVVDALMVNADGELLNRTSMGEELFWALRGGGANNFGVVLSYKIRLVDVPPQVTTFSITRTLNEDATKLVEMWQTIAPQLVDDLWIRVMASAADVEATGNRTIRAIFQGMFLGQRQELLPVMEKSFPELGLKDNDLKEMSWVQSTISFAGYDIEDPSILLSRKPEYNSSFKGKSDFVREPIPEMGWEEIWKFMMEGKDEPLTMILEPWGGRVGEIAETEIAFPHRNGNLYNIQYFMRWFEKEEAVTERHLDWMRRLHELMTPYVSSNPRAAYLNYKDIDLGSSSEEGNAGCWESRDWGWNYYLNNYERLAKVKAKVDPENYFWNEQSIAPFSACKPLSYKE